MRNRIRAMALDDMRIIGEVVSVVMLLLSLGACTSLKPLAAEPEDLQR